MFAQEYLKDCNATQAAIRAGYSARTAKAQGSRLLTKVDVRQWIADTANKSLSKMDITKERVLAEMARLAFSDLRGCFDEAGNLKPIKELTDDQIAAIASVEVVKRNMVSGDGAMEYVHKIKSWDKPKALEMLARHLGLIAEKPGPPETKPVQVAVVFVDSNGSKHLGDAPGELPDKT